MKIDYPKISLKVRCKILEILHKTKSPHIGSSFSCVDILIALYFKIMRIDPAKPYEPSRDRFIFSKGHACPALYAVLAQRGFISAGQMESFAVNGGCLQWHPDRDIKKGIELSTGSLGHGLSVGAGMALAAKKDKQKQKIYVLLSDGELNEGSTWEAVLFASHHKLDNLTVIVDYNKMQALGFTKNTLELEPMAAKWQAFGWKAQEADGHDFKQIFKAFASFRSSGKPKVLIAHTVKGKGVSFMENSLLWHYRAPDECECRMAKEELA